MLSVQLSIIKLVFRDPCVVKARFCPLDITFIIIIIIIIIITIILIKHSFWMACWSLP